MKNKYLGHEVRWAIETLAHKVCSALKLDPITVAWVPGITTAAINSRGDIILADIKDDAVVNASLFKRYCGYVVHELCHRKYTEFAYRADNPYVAQLKNALEDAWIEHKAIDQKITGNVEGLLTDLIDQMTAKALDSVTDWSDPRQYPFALAVYARRHAKTKMPLANGLEPIFAKATKALDKCNSSKGVLHVAEWVYAQLQKLGEDNAPQESPQDAPDQPQSADQGAGEGEGAGDDENGSGEADKQQADQTGGEVGDAQAPGANCEPVCVEPTLEVPDEKQQVGSGAYSKSSTLEDDCHHVYSDGRVNPMYTVKTPVSAKLQHEVRRLFERTDISEWSRNHKVGALNVHALPTVATGSDRLFKRRFEKDGIDSAVIILLDLSSSMFEDTDNRDGDRIRNAIATCIAMLDTLNRAGVSTCVVTFAGETSVLKPFNLGVVQAKKRLMSTRQAGTTNDWFAVRYCHELLYKRHEERKVLFVLTDGDGDKVSTREQVSIGERLGVTTIGVGIGLDVSKVYPNNIRVRNAKDLGEASFKQIKLAA